MLFVKTTKKGTLSGRLTRAYGAMFCAVLLLLSAVVFLLAYGFLVQRQKDALEVTSELIADHIVEELEESEALIDRDIIEEQNINAALDLYILDGARQIVNQTINFKIDESLLAIPADSPSVRFSSGEKMLLCFERPIVSGEAPVGTLFAALDLESEKDFLELLGLLLLGANVIGALAALFVGWRTSRNMLLPIDSMISDARQIGGDTRARLDVPDADDELRSLALTINGMLDRIQSAFEAQGRFTADASHELRTPLAILQGNADMLSRWGAEDRDVLTESIASIQRQTSYMNKLVENLLFLARSDGSRQSLQKSVFSVRELFDELLEEQTLLDENHSYSVDCPAELTLLADRSMIKQLLRAIIDNSVKYTPESGKITLGASIANSRVLLSVADSGAGMDEEHLSHIFERFYRADKARARATGGMGLGLSIAQAIVTAHGGEITAVSTHGEGTTITAVFAAPSQVAK